MENKKPLVSVIICTYNRKDMFKKALESVLIQDYENIEIIVGDNASSDGTHLLMEKYIKKYNNIKYIRREKNIGPFYNGYDSYKKSEGKYIYFLCDDDYLMGTTFIRNAVNVLENNENVVLVTGFVLMHFKEIGKYITIAYNDDFLINGIDYFIRQSTLNLGNIYPEIISGFFLIRREAIENNPSFVSFKCSGDVSLKFYSCSLGDIYFLHEFIGCYNLYVGVRETSNLETLYNDIYETIEFSDTIVKRYSDLYPSYKDFFEKYIPIKLADVFIRDRIYKTFNLDYDKKNITKIKKFLKNSKIKEKNENIYNFLRDVFIPNKYYFNFSILAIENIDFSLFRISKDYRYLKITIFGVNLTFKIGSNNKKYYELPKLYAYASKNIEKSDKLEVYYTLDKANKYQLSSDINIKDLISTVNIAKGEAITELNSVEYINREREREREFIGDSQSNNHSYYIILIYFCQLFKTNIASKQIRLFYHLIKKNNEIFGVYL